MSMEKMYDLAFSIDDQNIRLEQDSGIGEVHVIDLHPVQLRLLAERAGLLEPIPLIQRYPFIIDGEDEMQHLQIDCDEDGTFHLYQTQIRGMGGSDEHLILHPTQAAWLGARLLSLAYPSKTFDRPAEASSDNPQGQQLGLPV